MEEFQQRKRGRPPRGAMTYDRDAVAIAYSMGMKLEAIAALHGFTLQRVEQIARSHGLPRRRTRDVQPADAGL